MKDACGRIVVDLYHGAGLVVKGKVKMLCFWTAVCVTVLFYFNQNANGFSQTF